MTDSPLATARHYRQHFIQQLQQLLEFEELGAFILVVANASMDRNILAQLKPRIEQRFQFFTQQIKRSTDYPADDLDVFLKLVKLGLDNIQHSSTRVVSDWTLLFNPLRSLRPARNSEKKDVKLYQSFDAGAFHFNKPFLARERLWKGSIAAMDISLFYNKFPFADYHSLLLINAIEEKPQWLRQQDCQDIATFMHTLSGWDELGLAYNSLAAYASVNHQHWQMVLSKQPYPIEQPHWNHNGGQRDYPIDVQCFKSLPAAWQEIKYLQNSNQAFNLFIRHQKTYLVKRKKQGEVDLVDWAGGLAWSELAGAFTLTRLSDYENLTAGQIEQQMGLLKP